ncbi:MAG: DUF2889 domain-containing protein [Gammaproteobacteria bacterium]|nr:DUF2889 domain-containing protein [Gammaproteobacteria bacterium]
MSLSPPENREHLHTRRITCQGYRRSDGLWDIEAFLWDEKQHDFPNRDRGGTIHAGEPVHDMAIRVTLDLDFHIVAVEANTENAPYRICGGVADDMSTLVGMTIGPGWMRGVYQRIGGVKGCTHLVELLGPLATTAYQTMHYAMEERANKTPSRDRPRIINTCHTLASNGPVVQRNWPQFYDGDED